MTAVGAADSPVEDDVNVALWLAVAVSVLVVAVTGIVALSGAAAAWVAGFGAACTLFGLFAPHRGGVSVGAGLLAVASLVATSGMDLAASLLVNATMGLVVIAMLVLAELSFSARRGTDLDRETVRGFVAVHAVTSVVGVVAAVAILGLVLAVEWPRWLVIVPASVLVVALVVLMRLVRSYQRGLNTATQPPPPTGPPTRSLPPPPPAGASPRRSLPPPPPPRR